MYSQLLEENQMTNYSTTRDEVIELGPVQAQVLVQTVHDSMKLAQCGYRKICYSIDIVIICAKLSKFCIILTYSCCFFLSLQLILYYN